MAGRSLSRRTIALVVAVVLAGVAAASLASYVRGIERRALRGQEPVDVFVAKDIIPQGVTGDTAISRGLIERATVPRKVAAEDAIRTLEEIKGKVADVTILKGEQIVAPRFVAPSEVRGTTLVVPANRHAMSVAVDIPPGVAGFIQPGDHVSMIAQITIQPGGQSGTSIDISRFVVQDVEVLAVGQRVLTTTTTGEEGQPQATTTVSQSQVLLTLALTPAQAEKLALVLFKGQVYFTLLPPGQKPVTTPGRTASNLFS